MAHEVFAELQVLVNVFRIGERQRLLDAVQSPHCPHYVLFKVVFCLADDILQVVLDADVGAVAMLRVQFVDHGELAEGPEQNVREVEEDPLLFVSEADHAAQLLEDLPKLPTQVLHVVAESLFAAFVIVELSNPLHKLK